MTPRIRRIFAFASTTLVLSSLFALPSAKSAEESSLLYMDIDTGGGYPSIIVAANLAEAENGVGVIGSTTPHPATIALAICHAADNDEHQAVGYSIANAFSPQNQLAKIDLQTGAATLVGSPFPTELDMMALACSPDGLLYGIGQLNPANGDFNSLYMVDRMTGAANLIGPTRVKTDQTAFPSASGFLMALSFKSDGTLYGVSDGANGTEHGSTLWTVNRVNGVAANPVHINVDAVMGLAIAGDGKFYVADYTRQSKIYALDPVTGMTAPILATHLDFVNNIAFKPDDE
jgi:hypothetical protein